MGLGTTHDCWHGAYSAFHRWRCQIAEVAGIPLELMEGFHSQQVTRSRLSASGATGYCADALLEMMERWLPLKWDSLKPDALHILLRHSDCDGSIESKHCGPIADRLEEVIPLLPGGEGGGHIGNWRDKTQQFIDGLRAAADAGEDVEFG